MIGLAVAFIGLALRRMQIEQAGEHYGRILAAKEGATIPDRPAKLLDLDAWRTHLGALAPYKARARDLAGGAPELARLWGAEKLRTEAEETTERAYAAMSEFYGRDPAAVTPNPPTFPMIGGGPADFRPAAAAQIGAGAKAGGGLAAVVMVGVGLWLLAKRKR